MIGSVLGNYRILEKLGEGGMGTVYKAVDFMLEREVAIKILNPDLARRADLAERFRTEAIVLARLSHPNIATLFGMSRQNDSLFMVMEFVKGESVETRIVRSGKLRWEESIGIICQVLDALQYAHQMGVVHRDIKPANLMISEGGTVKIMDFGIAHVLGAEHQTTKGRLLGSLAYMSPEQIQGEDLDGRADIYSTAAVLYEMLTGQLPFTAPSDYELMQMQVRQAPKPPELLIPEIPAWLSDGIMRSLAKQPSGRHRDAHAFKTDLEEGLERHASATNTGRPLPVTRVHTDQSMSPSALRATRVADQFPADEAQSSEAAPKQTRIASGVFAPDSARTQAPPLETRQNIFQLLLMNWKWLVIGAIPVVLVITAILWHSMRSRPVLQPSLPPPQTETAAVPASQEPAPAAQTAAAPEPIPQWEVEPDPVKPPAADPPPAPVDVKAPPAKPKAPASKTRTRTGQQQPPTTPDEGNQQGTPQPPAEEGKPAAPSPPPAKPAEEPKAAQARPAEPTPAAEFSSKIKVLIPQGDKSKERDAKLRMDSEKVLIMDAETGVVLKRLDYGAITGAVYSKSKNPRGKSGTSSTAMKVLSAPVFFLKGAKHWFTLQTQNDTVILRLDQGNYGLILSAFEKRSGKTVEIEKEEKN